MLGTERDGRVCGRGYPDSEDWGRCLGGARAGGLERLYPLWVDLLVRLVNSFPVRSAASGVPSFFGA